MENMGQKNTLNGGLHIYFTNTEGEYSSVKGYLILIVIFFIYKIINNIY